MQKYNSVFDELVNKIKCRQYKVLNNFNSIHDNFYPQTVKYIKIQYQVSMQINMIRHGYNLQRRKMYPLNPRNNMVSTVDMTWDKSLQNEQKFATTRLKNKSIEEKQQIKQHYTDLIDRQIETQRVLPMQKESLRYDQYIESSTGNEHYANSKNMGKSTFFNKDQQSQRKRGHLTSRQILQPVNIKPQLKSSGNLSRTVFGYEINPQSFKRESYLTKILSDRLEPYLEQATSTHKRHKSVMTNQIIDLGY